MNLPIEIFENVMLYLPEVYWIFVCQLVCREWRNNIDQCFSHKIRLFLFHLSLDPKETKKKRKTFNKQYCKYLPSSIIEQYPKNNFITNYFVRTLECAAKSGNLELLKYLLLKYYSSENPVNCRAKINSKAAKYGHLEILKWGKNKFDWGSEYASTSAVKGGILEVVKLMYGYGGFGFDSVEFSAAAASGNLEMVKWVWEKCQGRLNLDSAYSQAAIRGHIHILEYLKGQDMRFFVGELLAIPIGACGSDLHIIEWMRSNGFKWNRMIFSEASKKGDLSLFKWALINKIPIDKEMIFRSAYYFSLKCDFEALKWIKKHFGIPEQNDLNMHMSFYEGAARETNWRVAKWLQKNKFILGANESCTVAYYGRIDFFKWLFTNKTGIFNENTYINAIKGGNLEVLKFLKSVNCPEPRFLKVPLIASDGPSRQLFEWVIENHNGPFGNIGSYHELEQKDKKLFEIINEKIKKQNI